jgi:hypothetical protein
VLELSESSPPGIFSQPPPCAIQHGRGGISGELIASQMTILAVGMVGCFGTRFSTREIENGGNL